ncbi:MAG: hypothetical protein R3F17_10800 [Planctomycetota bacterium]
MCDRHRLPYDQAEALLPLIQRALISPDPVRDRILSLVDRNLAKQLHSTSPGSTLAAVDRDLDEEVLLSVAKVLHIWNGGGRPTDFGKDLPGLFPGGFEVD